MFGSNWGKADPRTRDISVGAATEDWFVKVLPEPGLELKRYLCHGG